MQVNKSNILLYLVFITIVITSLTLVNADDYINKLPEPVKQGTCINLTQNCANCTYVNISSVFDGTQFILNGPIAMTKNGSDYYYRFCSTSKIATYIYCMDLNPSGSKESSCVSFDITATGQKGITFLIILILSLAFLLLIISLFVDIEFVVLASGLLFLISGIFLLIFGLDTFNNLYSQAIALVCLGFGIILIFASYGDNIIYTFKNKKDDLDYFDE